LSTKFLECSLRPFSYDILLKFNLRKGKPSIFVFDLEL
jgi:hypothetical protein